MQLAIERLKTKSPLELLEIIHDSTQGAARVPALCLYASLQIDPIEKVRVLTSFLHDSSSTLVDWVLHELALLLNTAAIAPLRTYVSHAPDIDHQIQALCTLGTLQDSWIIPLCVDLLQTAPEGCVGLLAKALGDLGSIESVRSLEAAIHSVGLAQRWWIAAQLGRLRNRSSEAILLEHMGSEEHSLTERVICGVALANLGNPQGLTFLASCITKMDEMHVFSMAHIMHTFSDFVANSNPPTRAEMGMWIQQKSSGQNAG